MAQLCRRLAISLESGIEVRKIFVREAEGRAPAAMRSRMRDISNTVAGGGGLAEAFDAAGSYFPSLMRELLRVGEQSGHLDEVFRHLADHYEYQDKLRREFLAAISWPMAQLSMALTLVGLVILVSGLIGGKDLAGRDIDILGFGLRGMSGMITYFIILGCIAAAFIALLLAARRGAFWARPIQRGALRLPVAGKALETLAVSRFAWSLHLTSESGMNLLNALPLCLQATQNDRYISQTDAVLAAVRRGDTLTDALSATHAFPLRFLDVLDVGERSGRLPETMKRLSSQYQEEAQGAIKVLMQVASWAVSFLVMGVVVYFIFRLAMFYIGTIQAAGRM